MYSKTIRNLGLAFGPAVHPTTTSFGDAGNIALDSPLRAAYRHISPTFVGFAAGAMRLLRDPFVLHGLTSSLPHRGVSLAEHLLRILGSQLAAVYGDCATLTALTNYLTTSHMRVFKYNHQPAWFSQATGGQRDFRANDPKLLWNVTQTLAAQIATVHQACGLIPAGLEAQYLDDMFKTVVEVTGLEFVRGGRSIAELRLEAQAYQDFPLLKADLLAEAGVPALLGTLAATPIGDELVGDDRTIGSLLHYITVFMFEPDCTALGLVPSDLDKQAALDWAARYAVLNQRFLAMESGADMELRIDDLIPSNEFFQIAGARH